MSCSSVDFFFYCCFERELGIKKPCCNSVQGNNFVCYEIKVGSDAVPSRGYWIQDSQSCYLMINAIKNRKRKVTILNSILK